MRCPFSPQKNALGFIPVWDDWSRRLQVGTFLGEGRIGAYRFTGTLMFACPEFSQPDLGELMAGGGRVGVLPPSVPESALPICQCLPAIFGYWTSEIELPSLRILEKAFWSAETL